MNTKTLRACASLLAALYLFIGVGCNTMSGAGKDIEAAGGAIKKEAQENKTY